jgi:hypothetical protein
MKVFTYVGNAIAVVIADDAEDAAYSLNAKLYGQGFIGEATEAEMIEFPSDPRESIRILKDGIPR